MRPALLVLLFWACGPCAMAQTLVWDPGEIARLAAQRAQIALALSSLAILQQRLNNISGGLGLAGVRSQPVLQPLSLPNKVDNPWPSGLGASGQSASAVRQDSQWLRQTAWQAAIDGLSLAASTDRAMSSLSDDSDALLSAVNSAPDLRGDIQANSAIALALLIQSISIKAMLAVSLQQHALTLSMH